MATAKKTARKKPAAKSKSVSARVTKKPVVKKTTVTIKKTKLTSPFDVIHNFLRGSTVVYLVLAGAVAVLVSSAASKIGLTVQAPDLLADGSGETLAPATELLFNVEPQYILVAMLGLSAVGSLLLATRLRSNYRAGVDNKTSGLRWLYIGITAALSVEFVSLLVGITDLMVLKMTAGLILVTTLLSWLAERENALANGPKWLAFGSSLFAGTVAWLAILGSLIGTSVYGSENFDWHVYAVSAVVLLGFIGFALNQYRDIKGRTSDYLKVEQSYWRTDFLYKLVVVAIVIVAL